MNNTIYNDIKSLYRFIIKNHKSFLIGLFAFFFVILAAVIFSFKIGYHSVLIEYKITDKTFEIDKSFKYFLHILIKDEINKQNRKTKYFFKK